MLGLVAFIVGIFALIGSAVAASVALALVFALLLPLLILGLFFRVSFALMRFAAMFVVLCFVAVWLI
jgi:hypothetical protein